jgi:hypothetical protein
MDGSEQVSANHGDKLSGARLRVRINLRNFACNAEKGVDCLIARGEFQASATERHDSAPASRTERPMRVQRSTTVTADHFAFSAVRRMSLSASVSASVASAAGSTRTLDVEAAARRIASTTDLPSRLIVRRLISAGIRARIKMRLPSGEALDANGHLAETPWSGQGGER